MADRYCRNCGHELAENNRFCTNCGTLAHQAGQIPTPEADTAAPPPPMQQTHYTAGSEQGKVSALLYWIAFLVLAGLAFAFGDDGTIAGAAGVIVATVWVYKDAKSRGMDAGLWVVGMILLAIVAFPLYFFKRRPRGSGV